MSLALLGCLGLVLFSGQVFGDDQAPTPKTIILSPTGNDQTGDGSLEKPFRSLVRASKEAHAGDSLVLRGGVYTKSHEAITLEGTSKNPILIREYAGEHAVLNGQNNGTRALIEAEDKSQIVSVLDLRNSKHVIVDGLEIDHSEGYGISVWESEYITIRNTEIHHTWSRALGGTGAHLVFENNTIHHAVLMNENEKVFEDRAKGVFSYWACSAATWFRKDGSPSKDVTWRGNKIYWSWGEGIDALHVDGVVIENNEISNVYSVLIYLDHSRNITVKGNYLYNTTTEFIRRDVKDSAGGILMASEHYNNTPPMMLENVTITNNIIVNASTGIGFWRDPDNKSTFNKYRNLTISNNIIKDANIWAVSFRKIEEPKVQELSPNVFTNNVIYNGINLAEGSTDTLSVRIENPELWNFSDNVFPDGLGGIVSKGFKTFKSNKVMDPEFVDPRAISKLKAKGFDFKESSPLKSSGIGLK